MATGKVIQADNIDGLKTVKNFISNGLATLNTTGWATYADAAGARPVDGTGGSPTLVSFTRSTTSPLSDAASFLFTVTGGSSAQGEGASYGFTIDAAYKAKVLKIEADYIVNSGTFVAGSSSANSDVIVYIYDVTNGVLIEPSSFKFLSNSTTISDKFSATFQTSATGTSYRLIFHVASTSTAAYALKFDNISVSPSQYVYGSPVVDLGEYTPVFTNLGTVTAQKFEQYKVGKKLKVKFRFTAASGGASVATVSIPPGLTVSSTGNTVVGAAWSQSTSSKDVFITAANGESVIRFIFNNSGGASLTGSDFGSGVVDGWFEVDILGWSSSVQVSDGYYGQVVAARASKSANFTQASGDNVLIYDTVVGDNTNSYNSTTGEYTVPSAGDYWVAASVITNTNNATSTTIGLLALVNNSAPTEAVLDYKTGGSVPVNTYMYLGGSALLKGLKAGDKITVKTRNDAISYNYLGGSGNGAELSISKLSGHPTISSVETNALMAINQSGQSINATPSTITNWDIPLINTHGSFNRTTGVFTFNSPGLYFVHSDLTILSSSGDVLQMYAKHTGAGATVGVYKIARTLAAGVEQLVGGMLLDVRAGDEFRLQAYSSVSRNLEAALGNKLNIFKVK